MYREDSTSQVHERVQGYPLLAGEKPLYGTLAQSAEQVAVNH